jgi:hypothetical protein
MWRRLAVPSLSHVLGHRSGTDLETEAGEHGLDALLTPKRILPRHAADQLPELQRNAPPPASPPLPRTPTPVRLTALSVPAQNSLGLDDEQRIAPASEAAARHNPEPPNSIQQARALLPPLQVD